VFRKHWLSRFLVTRHVTGNAKTIDIARGLANLAIASRCTNQPR
jgi:hypothetical protein